MTRARARALLSSLRRAANSLHHHQGLRAPRPARHSASRSLSPSTRSIPSGGFGRAARCQTGRLRLSLVGILQKPLPVRKAAARRLATTESLRATQALSSRRPRTKVGALLGGRVLRSDGGKLLKDQRGSASGNRDTGGLASRWVRTTFRPLAPLPEGETGCEIRTFHGGVRVKPAPDSAAERRRGNLPPLARANLV